MGPPPSSRVGAPPGRRAPARGVDVKPLPGNGPGGPEKAQKPRFWGIPAKKAIFRHFGQKWLFLAIFSKKCPVATGLKTPKSPKNGRNPQNGQKVRFCGSQPPRRGGFYINPSRRGPVPGFWTCLGRGGFPDSRGDPDQGLRKALSDLPGPRDPGTGTESRDGTSRQVTPGRRGPRACRVGCTVF